MRRRLSVHFGVLSLLLLTTFVGTAQPDTPPRIYWEYGVDQIAESFLIVRKNLETQAREVLHEVSQQVTFEEVLPDIEIEQNERFYAQFGRAFKLYPQPVWDIRVKTVVPSFDHSFVAFVVQYQSCSNPLVLGWQCFGTSHIMLVSTQTSEARLLMNLAYHNLEFSPNSQYRIHDIQRASSGLNHWWLTVHNIEWLTTNDALITTISTNSRRSAKIVAIPINGTKPFLLGSGWLYTLSSDARQISILEQQETSETLYIVDFQPETSSTQAIIANQLGAMWIDERKGMFYIGHQLYFGRVIIERYPTRYSGAGRYYSPQRLIYIPYPTVARLAG